MQFGTYAPWDYYPKMLRHNEIVRPLSVLREVFSAGYPPDHRRWLKNWRNYVLADKFYNHKKHGPGNLIFTYRINLNLVEAVYLLLLDHGQTWPPPPKITEEQLKNEQETWYDFPDNLSLKEQIAPIKVMPLPSFRDHLMDWLEAALSSRAIDESATPADIVTVYESLLRLYSAAWIIQQRSTEQPCLKIMEEANTDEAEKEAELPAEMQETEPTQPRTPKAMATVSESAESSSRVSGPVIVPPVQLTPAEALGLDEVKEVILKAVPTVQMIIHLGTHQSPFTYYLLILIDKSEKLPEHDISNKIKDKCKQLVSVFAIVHKVSSAREGISEGNRFWNLRMKNANVIYKSAELVLPEYQQIPDERSQERVMYYRQRWGGQGLEFLKGAKRYQQDGNYRLAAFLLHQTVESSLAGIIRVALGYRIAIHNLSRMLRLTLLFTENLKGVFELDTVAGVRSFALLQDAYSHARYRDGFDPDAASIEMLMERVETLIVKVEMLYEQYNTIVKTETVLSKE